MSYGSLVNLTLTEPKWQFSEIKKLKQYYMSTSLHKYVVKLFSATFLEHRKFETKLNKIFSLGSYLSTDNPTFKIFQEMCLSDDFEYLRESLKRKKMTPFLY